MNLLANAVKHNREQGTVEVTCTQSTPGRVHIRVKDTGAGLPPERLAQLLQTFGRLGHEGSVEEGTTIGLALTRRLAELMGVVVGAESTVGLGSTFWIELNSDAAPRLEVGGPEPAAVPEVPDGVREPRTLLYVEDDTADLELVAALIVRRPDVRLLSAQDGALGMALARVVQPAVILMDINLPGVSGIQALKMLRDDPATAHIPVVALSAYAAPREMLEAGFFGALTKPFRFAEFMETLDLALACADKGPGHGNGM
jgi:CheY-like chemotaxis protein